MNKRQLVCCSVLATICSARCLAAVVDQASPESVGFSSERLERLHSLVGGEVESKQLAGAITLVARHGKLIDLRTYGQRNIAANAPMTRDTIFRAYSMSKPVTGVAMMILYEQGKWLPYEPLSKYIPEFANLKVFNGVGPDGKPLLANPDRPPTIGDLMTHSAGFSYGSGSTVVDAMYKEQKLMQSHDLHEFVTKLAAVPLNYQPGKGWTYSVSMDVEGYLVEKLSGQTLPDFMRQHIFEPLGMKDTGFYVPQDKRARFAANYHDTPEGKLEALGEAGKAPDDYAAEPAMPSGGGGLVTTVDDYYKFAQMLLNGGELNGRRILSPATVKLMTSNHLPEALLTGQYGIGQHIMRPGFGYGYNCAVVFDPGAAALPDGKGTFFWDGAAGTWFWGDPANQLVSIGMIQRMTSKDNHNLEYRAHSTVYAALTDPAK